MNEQKKEKLELLEDQPEMADAVIQSIKRRSVTGAISYFLRTLVLQGIGIASIFVLSAFFSPEEFGIYGLVIQIIGILIFFSDIGLAAALVQKKQEPSRTDYVTVFTVQQILAWVIVLIAVVLVWSGWIEAKTGAAGNWILLTLAISFPLSGLKTIPSIILERKLDFSKLVIPQIIEQLCFQILLIYLAWQGWGVISYAYAIFVRSIVGVIAMYFVQPWTPGLALDRSALKTLLSYGFKFQLNDFLARLKDQLFFVAIGAYLPLREFGFIQWSKNWSLYPYNLTVQNVMAVTFPTFSRLQNNKDLLRKAIEKSLFFISLLIFPILVGMAIFITPFIHLLPIYQKWEPAIPSLIFFTLDIAWSAIGTPLINALNAIGEINKTLKIMILRTVLTWTIAPVCLYLWGFTGVAIATFVINITSLIPIWYLQKMVGISVWSVIYKQLFAACIMLLIGYFGMDYFKQSWTAFIAGGVIVGLSYVLTLGLTARKEITAQIRSLRS